MRIRLTYSDGTQVIKRFKSEETFLRSPYADNKKMEYYEILLQFFDLVIKLVRLKLK